MRARLAPPASLRNDVARARPSAVLAAPIVALLLCAVVAVSGARGSDWPAHLFRVGLFRESGLTLWNGQWYGGHYTLGYSVLFPPIASWLGPVTVGILSSVVASGSLAMLLHRYFGTAGAVAACWFAVGMAVNLAIGRLPFGLGIAFGLVALVALDRSWRWIALLAAPLTSLASPVAGVFLGIALAGVVVDGLLRRRAGESGAVVVPSAMAALAVTPIIATAALFPDPGVFPFRWAAFVGVLASCVGLVIVLPPSARVLRVSAAIAAVVSVPLFFVANPLGGNMTRIVAFFVLPVLGAAMWSRRRRLVAIASVPLALWLVLPGVASAEHIGDPAADASYHQEVIDVVNGAGGPAGRVEVPFTAGHWEVAFIASELPIARGWERQVDMDRNEILYDDDLTADEYRRWVDEHAVRWIALPDVDLDEGGEAEAALLEQGLPWLTMVHSSEHWRIWEVVDATPIVEPPGRLLAESSDGIVIAVDRPATVLVRAWYTPYWSAEGDGACVMAGEDGTLEVVVSTPGTVELQPQFSLDPLLDEPLDGCGTDSSD